MATQTPLVGKNLINILLGGISNKNYYSYLASVLIYIS